MAKKLTQEQFVARVIEIYGDLYDCSKAIYISTKDKVDLFCNKHGKDFSVSPNKLFTRGFRCRECVIEDIRKSRGSNTQEFIEKAELVHGIGAFDYSNVVYITALLPVIISCNVCEYEFEQTPNNHLSGHGCRYCEGRKYLNTETFIKKSKEVHGGSLFDYSKSVYVDNKTDIEIVCNSCNKSFWMLPSNHLQGQECYWCCRSPRIDTAIFIARSKLVHGEGRYDYSKSIYVSAKEELVIYCNLCKMDFEQQPTLHLAGHGCQRCPCRSSKSEDAWLDLLGIPQNYRRFVLMIDGKACKVDGYDPLTKTIFEFYGDYWHGNPNRYDPNKIHAHKKNKTMGDMYQDTIDREARLISAGYKVVSIWESDWKKINKVALL